MLIQGNPIPGTRAALCNCRLSLPASDQVHNLLQAWIADHPEHTRKQHIFAYDLFQWIKRRLSGNEPEGLKHISKFFNDLQVGERNHD